MDENSNRIGESQMNIKNNKYIIIITGELAAGKTSYGRKISEELKIPFFSKDIIKEILFDSLSDNNLEYEAKRKIGVSSYAVFYYIIEEQMKVGLPIIAESNFVKESVPILKKLLKKWDSVVSNNKCQLKRLTFIIFWCNIICN